MAKVVEVSRWNRWMTLQTHVPAKQVLGRRLSVLYPCLKERGLEKQMRQVMEGGTALLLSPVFHLYFIPIRLDRRRRTLSGSHSGRGRADV